MRYLAGALVAIGFFLLVARPFTTEELKEQSIKWQVPVGIRPPLGIAMIVAGLVVALIARD